MIEKIIAGSVRNKMLVIIMTAAVVAGGVWATLNIPLDAIPDLSDVQVIIFTSYPGQAPQLVEDQVTYPLTTKMLAVPFAKVVRGYSFFGFSFVYIIFEDGTDTVLGSEPGAGIPLRHSGLTPTHRQGRAGAGRNRCGLGLRVCPDVQETHVAGVEEYPGLVPEI